MRFDYVPARIVDLKATVNEHPKTHRRTVTAMSVCGEQMQVSSRFFQSLFSRFGFNNATFKYFDHAEVFQRIAEKAKSSELICCIERTKDENTLLACSNPKKAVAKYDNLVELLEKHGTLPDAKGAKFTYHDGVVRSEHQPKFQVPWAVGGDTFQNRFVLDTPIDGYGKPSIYLSVMRQICTNGAVAQTKAFRSALTLGKGEDSFDYPLQRALDGFNNEDGFQALQSRIESAQHSWASIHETQNLYKKLVRMHSRKMVKVNKNFLGDNTGTDGEKMFENSPLISKFNSLVGDIRQEYGLANLDALSAKRQKALPAPCKVYDLFNFATEVATHHSTNGGDRYMQAFVGELIAGGTEYDLEGTYDQFSDWRDFLATDEAAVESKIAISQLTA